MSDYKIKKLQKDKAKKLNVEIKPSTNKKKKVDVFKDGKKVGSVGASGYKDYATYVDDIGLKEANKNYKVARGKALKGVKVTTVSPEVFHEWSGANKKKGGQVKMERVMNEEKFAEWEEFVKNS